MTIWNDLETIAGSTVILLGLAMSPASAVTLAIGGTPTSGAGYVSSQAGATTIDFDSGLPTTGFATYSPGTVVQGSQVGQYATPAGDTTPYLTLSPVGSGVVGATGAVTIDFQQALDYFGLYWGSVDSYNAISFYDHDTLLQTFGGQNVSTTAAGSWTGPSDNLFANFFADPGKPFNKVVLDSSGIAFESDNHAYRVSHRIPEPTPVSALLLGLVGVGAWVRRQFGHRV
jgi:hypothetical protein